MVVQMIVMMGLRQSEWQKNISRPLVIQNYLVRYKEKYLGYKVWHTYHPPSLHHPQTHLKSSYSKCPYHWHICGVMASLTWRTGWALSWRPFLLSGLCHCVPGGRPPSSKYLYFLDKIWLKTTAKNDRFWWKDHVTLTLIPWDFVASNSMGFVGKMNLGMKDFISTTDALVVITV